MVYSFKLDDKEAILDNANKQVIVYASESGRDGRSVVDANCIPREVVNMTYADYTEFLKQRRVMMAQKIRKYYESL